MRAFSCGRCGQLMFFENSVCLRCGAALGFSPARLDLIVLDDPAQPGPPLCANSKVAECNWVVEPDAQGDLCRSCELTRVRPADGDAEGLVGFASAEAAKRRLVYELLDLKLPIGDDLGFDLLASRSKPVVTGHDDGLITIDLAETDDVRREQRRAQLGEPYRTMLGHFRHEIGHYYWPILIEQTSELEPWRAVFGDERLDYNEAIDRHYAEGPPSDWSKRFVSAYATMHPWEDWAETFAHYLHIRDTLQTAAEFGLVIVGPRRTPERSLTAVPAPVDGRQPFAEVIGEWLPLTYALNAVNRSMGRDDLYPFTLAPTVIDKLTFVHDTLPS
jgi:hypothetical protein